MLTEKEAREKVDQMSYQDRDAIYRAIWVQYVEQDCDAYFIEDGDMSESDRDKIIKLAAYDFVYNSNYDCSMSYWDNIANVLVSAQNYVKFNPPKA